MNFILDRTIFLLVTAIVVAIIARRLHLPYTVGLVVAGIILAVAHIGSGLVLTRDLIFDVILPSLLFEASVNIVWKTLRRDLLVVLALTVGGVVISALFVAFGMAELLNWPWRSALIFGVLIAATDPVAVLAMFKDSHAPERLRRLIESESILNDGIAAVFFVVVLSWADGGRTDPSLIVVGLDLALTVAGGLMIGAICGGAAIFVAGRVTDHLVETALTTAAAYGSFLLAEHMHVSGVLATVAAGLVMGNFGVLKLDDNPNQVSEKGRAFILDFWEFAAFLANSLIFLLIGLRVAGISFAALGAVSLGVAILLVIIGRALAVYPLCLLFARSRLAIPLGEQHVLWWGGLRGAMALALALSLPFDLPLRDEIIVATFGVVTFSVLVQGLSMPVMLRKMTSFSF